ncbi:endolytic transglycosylase MltG [Imhoffiella purpurea]|uniref:Endolytic murein transglycosylase n=1 Tax=Imhoffiella purpurea TaxID=1249627 RepID=W9VEG5_9GAMM|nr:endolytic transglycosylase MltG [Imhoffiella purpurea]EXJ15366.1 protein YceG [Imhoffiella purpurea]
MFWRVLFIVLSLAILSFASGLTLDYYRFLKTPVSISGPTATLDIPRGTSLRALSLDLGRRGILDRPYYFVALAYLDGQEGAIKAGEYALTPDMTPQALLERITSGKVIEYSLTIVEGWTFRQALEALDAQGTLDGAPLSGLPEADLMERLGRPGQHPEGRFFPDTYRFPRHAERLDLLQRSLNRMDRILEEEWRKRQDDLPISTPYEALILASIIEKETAVAAERPRIGGVFVRRLRKGMRLQTDPTVIYGLGERFDGNLTRSHLRESTPYNTYVISGLPPTPIALPGREAIRAALQPESGESLYFVAKGDGTHVFSRTLGEHNRAVRRYILEQP